MINSIITWVDWNLVAFMAAVSVILIVRKYRNSDDNGGWFSGAGSALGSKTIEGFHDHYQKTFRIIMGGDLGWMVKHKGKLYSVIGDLNGVAGTVLVRFNAPLANLRGKESHKIPEVTILTRRQGKGGGAASKGSMIVGPQAPKGSTGEGMQDMRLLDYLTNAWVSPPLQKLPHAGSCRQFGIVTGNTGKYTIVYGLVMVDDHGAPDTNPADDILKPEKFADINGQIRMWFLETGKYNATSFGPVGDPIRVQPGIGSNLGGFRRGMRLYTTIQRLPGAKNFSAEVCEWVDKIKGTQISPAASTSLKSMQEALDGPWRAIKGPTSLEELDARFGYGEGRSREGLSYNSRESAAFGFFTGHRFQDIDGQWYICHTGWGARVESEMDSLHITPSTPIYA